MLHSHNFTLKVPDSAHKNKATSEEIEEWQKLLKRWISCAKRDSFDLHMQDETIHLQDILQSAVCGHPGAKECCKFILEISRDE